MGTHGSNRWSTWKKAEGNLVVIYCRYVCGTLCSKTNLTLQIGAHSYINSNFEIVLQSIIYQYAAFLKYWTIWFEDCVYLHTFFLNASRSQVVIQSSITCRWSALRPWPRAKLLKKVQKIINTVSHYIVKEDSMSPYIDGLFISISTFSYTAAELCLMHTAY